MTFIDLKNIEEKEPVSGFRARFVHSQNMTFAHWSITAGAELPEHAHQHEQVAMVISGRFELTVAGKSEVLTSGKVAVISPNALHARRTLSDCKIIDAFYPTREDYRDE